MGEYSLDQHTVSLLHFNDGIKDETGKVWTADGGAAVSTTQSKFGGSSLHLNPSQGLSIDIQDDFKFGTDDFTVDCWIYPTAINPSFWNVIFDNRKTTAGGTGFVLFLYQGTLSMAFDHTSKITSAMVGLNSWQHIAITRADKTLFLFLNGDLVYSEAMPHNLTDGYGLIGKALDGYNFIGYIDEFRISNVARWTSNFVPPSEPSSNAILRITMNDSSEREYRLPKADIDGFVNWFNRTVGTGNTCYSFDDIIDGSKEYLAFEKIISFEVIPVA